MENVSIFEQIHQFFQYLLDLLGQGIKSAEEIPNIISNASEYIGGFMSCVHYRFLPLLGFAIAVALLLKLLRLDGLH